MQFLASGVYKKDICREAGINPNTFGQFLKGNLYLAKEKKKRLLLALGMEPIMEYISREAQIGK